nr:peptidase M28 [Flavobacteriales bacterium]
MKLNILLLAALCASPTLVNGQRDTLVERYLNTITRQELQGHLEVLASDAYEGRETGFKGQKMAAEYLRKAFASMSIGPVPDW